MLTNQRIEYRNGKFELIEEPIKLNMHIPGVILQCALSGLCGTDIRMIRKERECNATIIGHEATTYIVDHNFRCTDVKIGQRVFLNPNPPKNKMYKGHLGHDRDGVFQKYIWLSEDDYIDYALNVVPTIIDDNQALSIEPLSCGWHTLTKLNARALPHQKIGVFGAGTLASVHLHLIKLLGVETENIYIFNRSLRRGNDAAARANISFENVNETTIAPQSLLDKLDLILLINSNADQYFNLATQLVAPNGTIVVFGGIAGQAPFQFDNQEVDLLDIRLNEKRVPVVLDGKRFVLQGTRGFTGSDTTNVVHALAIAENHYPSLGFTEHTPHEFTALLNDLSFDTSDIPLGKQVCNFF